MEKRLARSNDVVGISILAINNLKKIAFLLNGKHILITFHTLLVYSNDLQHHVLHYKEDEASHK